MSPSSRQLSSGSAPAPKFSSFHLLNCCCVNLQASLLHGCPSCGGRAPPSPPPSHHAQQKQEGPRAGTGRKYPGDGSALPISFGDGIACRDFPFPAVGQRDRSLVHLLLTGSGHCFYFQAFVTTFLLRVLRSASIYLPLGKSVSVSQDNRRAHSRDIHSLIHTCGVMWGPWHGKGRQEGSPVMSLSSEAQPPELQAWREAWTVPAVPREQEMAGQ